MENWISVEEKFPVKPDEYLCYSEEGRISVEKVSKQDITNQSVYCDSTDGGYATHWMNLPEPPTK